MRAAASLPAARFPLEYDKDRPAAILLPHLAALKKVSLLLQLRALAELQNGQSRQALEDVKLTFRLMDTVRAEPILISHLVRIAMQQIALQPVYEGLAQHRWSDTQLVELETSLAKVDFVADYPFVMHGEMVFQCGIVEFLRRHPGDIASLSDMDEPSANGPGFFAKVIPSGWFYQNELRCARLILVNQIPVADLKAGTFSPAKVPSAEEVFSAETAALTHDNFLERMLMPALGKVAIKFALAQTYRDLARSVIALERYRLAHGQFPQALDALAPQFIAAVPHDVINGDPLHYRLTNDGQFVLYSVGWNESDDGGEVVLKKGAKADVDTSNGDWVWKYPPRKG